MEPVPQQEQSVVCAKHNVEKQFICQACKVLMCPECISSHILSHGRLAAPLHINEYAASQKKVLSKHQQELSDSAKALDAYKYQLTQIAAKLSDGASFSTEYRLAMSKFEELFRAERVKRADEVKRLMEFAGKAERLRCSLEQAKQTEAKIIHGLDSADIKERCSLVQRILQYDRGQRNREELQKEIEEELKKGASPHPARKVTVAVLWDEVKSKLALAERLTELNLDMFGTELERLHSEKTKKVCEAMKVLYLCQAQIKPYEDKYSAMKVTYDQLEADRQRVSAVLGDLKEAQKLNTDCKLELSKQKESMLECINTEKQKRKEIAAIQKTITELQMTVCENGCKKPACNVCGVKCATCGGFTCKKCENPCQNCSLTYCAKCKENVKKCPNCSKSYCIKCWKLCEECKNVLCKSSECCKCGDKACTSCGRTKCRDCGCELCGKCKKNMCTDCTNDLCKVCLKINCAGCTKPICQKCDKIKCIGCEGLLCRKCVNVKCSECLGIPFCGECCKINCAECGSACCEKCRDSCIVCNRGVHRIKCRKQCKLEASYYFCLSCAKYCDEEWTFDPKNIPYGLTLLDGNKKVASSSAGYTSVIGSKAFTSGYLCHEVITTNITGQNEGFGLCNVNEFIYGKFKDYSCMQDHIIGVRHSLEPQGAKGNKFTVKNGKPYLVVVDRIKQKFYITGEGTSAEGELDPNISYVPCFCININTGFEIKPLSVFS